jgi:hypothetical protein
VFRDEAVALRANLGSGWQRRATHLGGRLPRVPDDRADGSGITDSGADAPVLGAPGADAVTRWPGGLARGIRSVILWWCSAVRSNHLSRASLASLGFSASLSSSLIRCGSAGFTIGCHACYRRLAVRSDH